MTVITSQKIDEKWISPLKTIGYTAPISVISMTKAASTNPELQKHLQRLFESFCIGIRSKKTEVPKQYLEKNGLDYQKLNIGFCSGQFHHRKDDEFRKPYLELGVLSPSDAPVNHPDRVAYTCFGTYGVVFPLKNAEGKIVNLYSIRIKTEAKIEQYLNMDGIFPAHPSPLTRRLYITQTIMDAASIIQSDTLENKEAVMALHDGKFLPEHEQVIRNLEMLDEIIIIKN